MPVEEVTGGARLGLHINEERDLDHLLWYNSGMDTEQISVRLEEIRKTLARAEGYDPHHGFPARFYVRDVSFLLGEIKRVQHVIAYERTEH